MANDITDFFFNGYYLQHLHFWFFILLEKSNTFMIASQVF